MSISNSSFHSTPRSTQSHTSSSSPIPRPQSQLIELIGAELDDQTFQFDTDAIARMLSPKVPRMDATSVIYPTLDDFECLIDDPIVKTAVEQLPTAEYTGWSTGSETQNYGSMAAFLTNCVEECEKAYDAIHGYLPQRSNFRVAKRTERWLTQLCFIPYDKETKDGIQNSKPLKPDIVGVANSEAAVQEKKTVFCWWSQPSLDNEPQGQRHYQIKIPMEMKRNWRDMVKQAGTYARSQFAVSPLRTFTLVIGANHQKQDLRFLIFHHGGLSASKAIKLDKIGCRAVQKILLSILLWQSAADAGLPPFTDGQSFHLPQNINIGSVWNVNHVFHHSLSTRGRNTYVASLESTKSGTKKTVSAGSKQTRYLTRSMVPRVINSTSPLTPTTSAIGTGKHSSSTRKLTSLSNSQKTQGTFTDSTKAIEATLDPISQREKIPRFLTAVEPSRVIPSKLYHSVLSKLVMKCSWPNKANELVEPRMYATCTEAFGTPQAVVSFAPCVRQNYPMCNSIFLPPSKEDIDGHYWPIINAGAKPVPKTMDCRTLWITILADEGQNLDECLSARDLCECILHSMIGWLTVYQRGFLHRDISIGNLLKLAKPVSRGRFNALDFIRLVFSPKEQEALNKSDLNYENLSQFIRNGHPDCVELLEVAQDLNTALNRCGLTDQCKAIIIDGDMAVYLPDYFNLEHKNDAFSGTFEFMSSRLFDRSEEEEEELLHSPFDDVWSFFWTILWATLNNRHHRGETNTEKRWRHQLCDGKALRETVAISIRDNLTVEETEAYSPILRQMAPLLREWYSSLSGKNSTWNYELVKTRRHASEKALSMLFHKFAYYGVLDFVHILLKHFPESAST